MPFPKLLALNCPRPNLSTWQHFRRRPKGFFQALLRCCYQRWCLLHLEKECHQIHQLLKALPVKGHLALEMGSVPALAAASLSSARIARGALVLPRLCPAPLSCLWAIGKHSSPQTFGAPWMRRSPQHELQQGARHRPTTHCQCHMLPAHWTRRHEAIPLSETDGIRVEKESPHPPWPCHSRSSHLLAQGPHGMHCEEWEWNQGLRKNSKPMPRNEYIFTTAWDRDPIKSVSGCVAHEHIVILRRLASLQGADCYQRSWPAIEKGVSAFEMFHRACCWGEAFGTCQNHLVLHMSSWLTVVFKTTWHSISHTHTTWTCEQRWQKRLEKLIQESEGSFAASDTAQKVRLIWIKGDHGRGCFLRQLWLHNVHGGSRLIVVNLHHNGQGTLVFHVWWSGAQNTVPNLHDVRDSGCWRTWSNSCEDVHSPFFHFIKIQLPVILRFIKKDLGCVGFPEQRQAFQLAIGCMGPRHPLHSGAHVPVIGVANKMVISESFLPSLQISKLDFEKKTNFIAKVLLDHPCLVLGGLLIVGSQLFQVLSFSANVWRGGHLKVLVTHTCLLDSHRRRWREISPRLHSSNLFWHKKETETWQGQ